MGIEVYSILNNIDSFISEFAKKYKVIVFDNRGVGRTDKPDEPYSIEMMAEDTIGLMDVLKIKNAHMGGSMGSCITQVIAAKYPERVNCLILYLATTNFSDTLKQAIDIPLKIDSKDEEIKKIPPESILNQLEASMKFDGRKLLGQIKAPTLIVNATKNQFITNECDDEIANGIMGFKFILVEGDHLFPATKPETLVDHALGFMEGTDPSN